MPTRKQRRRSQKERRHEYETVWVDAEGNELEEPPEDAVEAPEKRTNGSKPKTKAAPQRGGRAARVPQAPSWRRAAKRSLLLGVGIFVVVYISNAKHGNRTIEAFGFAGLYTLLFIPLTFTMDRWSYNRFQRRAAEQGQKQPKKR
ncbi:MAG TPA: hypothetical protein VKB70_08655 [Gaiellaceae bacterium]|nr:hypothetical protein [Gaiellaceae bacterium]